ncbi:NACHT, LRR and PYD domains-containing protein 1 homolog isoform X1 [Alosa sapidissima]|uniref:NACHT, LRR and PYD domains-containing protein 1 homolog isoform X1 n=1 Tax=Alosa sapidissima TaxID=34773 RepID=UPI001C081310|nr:NACHT, LRR and PYD domains-containing protein 1 homolog isoform X1 [Alosa sapidissima]
MKCICMIFLLQYCTLTTAVWFVVVGPDRPVVGVAGGDALLPCLLKPNISAVDMEVMWLIGSAVVHRYRNHKDEADLQLPDYQNRTSLSTEGLQRGNVSLRLTSVQFSDANTYRCYIVCTEGVFDTNIELQVEAVGSTPNISVESLGDGSVRLQCESSGWSPEPQMEWLDSEGQILPAEATFVRIDHEGFTVRRSVTVLESESSRFLCRVSNTIMTKENPTHVPRIMFALSRHRLYPASFVLFFLVSTVVLSICILKKHQGLTRYKEWVISSVESERSPFPDNLHDHYTDPLIIKLNVEEDKVSTAGEIFQETCSLDKLFSVDDGRPDPNAIILQGHTGCGKAFTVQKIMCDWASGAAYLKRFALVLLLKGTELRQELLHQEEKKRSLVELISPMGKLSSVTGHLLKHTLKDAPHKVLFIIDGFDELRLSSAVEPSSHLPSQPFTRAPPAYIINALLGGRILPESFLLVTTRPTASKALRKMLQQREQRFTEILGFSENKVGDYFKKFFENQERAEEEYQLVRENDFLFSSCLIPILCWMICSVLKKNPRGFQERSPVTRTSIFLLYCTSHIDNVRLKRLGQLAESKTLTGEVLFDEKSVYDTITDPTKSPLLRKYSLGWNNVQQVMYGFVHPTIQEFISALYYITLKEEEMLREVKELLNSLKGPSADETIQLRPIIRFLFGLSNANVWSLLSAKLKSTADNKSIRNILEQWIFEEVATFVGKDMRLFILHCLFELHEEEFVRSAMKKWWKLDFASFSLKRIDCWALHYCLQCRPAIARLNLSNCNLTAEKLKLLEPALSQLDCKELWLDVEDLSDANVADLVSALSTGRILGRLRVENSLLSDESLQQVLTALEKQKSVGSVILSVKTVSLLTANMVIRHVHKHKVTGIMSITLTWKKSPNGDGHEDRLCSSLRVGKNQHSFTVSVEDDGSTFQPAVSQLSATLPNCEEIANWTPLLKSFHELRALKSNPELEKNVEMLFSSLRSLPGLKKVYLNARVQKIQWAFELLSLIHNCANLQEMDVMVKHRLEQETLCSFLSLKKAPYSTLKQEAMIRLTVEQNTLGISSSQTPPSFSVDDRSWRKPSLTPSLLAQEKRWSPLSLISLTFPGSEYSTGNWKLFLDMFYNLNKNTSTDVETDVDTLFTTLRSVRGLREVELRVQGLTESWTHHILSFIRDQEIDVHVLKKWESCEESLCSSFFVRKTASTFRLAVEHLRKGSSTPALSYISILVDTNTVTPSDWTDYLKSFHTLKHEIESRYLYDFVGPLLFPLGSLAGLREVELRVSCLTEVWADNILSLIDRCSNLQEVRLSAGHSVVSDGLSVWTDCGPLLLEEITHLQETLIRPDCTITLTGIKRRTVEVSSHFKEGRLQCNRPVRITIRGNKSTEDFLEHIREREREREREMSPCVHHPGN